ncbi:unnamed protein product [Sphenostylis stenocarpa]|uniref:ADP-ribosyl cyclase/cyclic ADP-ribose hydrolase n=1 Tax=Sphenostylis stenocarpa TaxID=92480 RepID=A0AA86SWE4_9FABA|nr:unnamed protein product [Sphenostylis stenocarpa]
MIANKLGLRKFWDRLGRRSSSTSNSSPSPPSSNLNPSNSNSPASSSSNLNPLSTTNVASTSSSDTIQNQNYRYDVFISFRGSDTRNSFVDHLYSHLIRKGIFVFKDDKKLHKGESISSQLLRAIQDSRVSIIVFSQNYASSTWCLDEMAAVADCKQQSNQTVFPVFYDVDPSHVRNQNGTYEDAFILHKTKFKEDPHKVRRWKNAMKDLANTAGWDVSNKYVLVLLAYIPILN